MTVDELKKYLVSIATGGVENPALSQIVAVAVEGGYAAVWGAAEWKFRRRYSTAKSTTANQEYTSLIDQIECVTSIVLVDGDNSISVDLKDEDSFNWDTPYPPADLGQRPFTAKVVFNPEGGSGDKWRVYWYPVPDKAYTVRLTYHKRADVNDLPALPSYMLDAVIEACFVKMQRAPDQRFAIDQVYQRVLERAILADKTTGGYAPRLGADPGWDDSSVSGGGGSVWDPRSI